MWKSMEKNKKYVSWIIAFCLFGAAGLFLIPVVIFIIKLSKLYPKAFAWITIVAFIFICIYLLLFKQNWNMSFMLMCIAFAIGHVFDTNNR